MPNKPRSSRQGRNLELLLKRIKEHQLPAAKVTSPEFVDDKDTGQRREVDIGIRVPRGDGEIFIAIECRDRRSQQSVEWIEQLISKKHSVSADALVAVTSSEFSEPAKIKGLKHGVILARMSEKLPEEIAQLASSYLLTFKFLAPEIVAVDLKLPAHLNADLESYCYRHPSLENELTLTELAQAWTTPNLIRAIPRYVEDWSKESLRRSSQSASKALWWQMGGCSQ